MGAPAAFDTSEQRMLRDSVRGYLAMHWPAVQAVALQCDRAAVSAIWRGLAGQGLTAIGIDHELGGLVEAVIVMEELGRAACPVPLGDAVLANLMAMSVDEAMRVAFAIGEEAGIPIVRSGKATGTVRFVEGAGAVTHVVVALADDALALIDCTNATIEPTRALGLDGLATMHFDAAAARTVPIDPRRLDELVRVRRLLLAARAHGAARRAFELIGDYAKERRQFGKPIGSFQAIQHKLADAFIALEGTRLAIAHAAREHDRTSPHWQYFAAAAHAFAGPALRKVSLDTQHAFGAIGYAEEHEAPRHFRRVHIDLIAMGGAQASRAALATHFFDERAGLPRFDLGAAGNALRDQVGAWLTEHWSGARKSEFDAREFHDREFDAQFARDIGRTGWIGLAWPREQGGQARSPIEQIAFMEEMERAEAPRIGASIQSTALLLYGTRAQQQTYLPEILRGEAMHGMGYSEPQAGSDLAAMTTRAVRDGDEWVINGQKIWTTTWWGQYMFLAARTDRDAKPAHAGISMFIVPMSTPGIDIKPAKTMYDGTFSNIFYDNVRVPADALLGELNGGWKVLIGALATERGLVGGGIVLKVAHAFECLLDEIRSTANNDPLARDRVAQLAADIEVGRQLMLYCAELAASGETPPEYGAISKVFSSELMERFGEAALDLLGPRGALSQGSPGAVQNGRFEQGLRHSLMWVISIGTNEIQRSLIAQRGLGLPR
jgi:alkylation response protein AidB-like acyl-CoA dehydrogenase